MSRALKEGVGFKYRYLPALVSAGVLCMAPSAIAATHTVDDDKADCPAATFTSIQAAVDAEGVIRPRGHLGRAGILGGRASRRAADARFVSRPVHLGAFG